MTSPPQVLRNVAGQDRTVRRELAALARRLAADELAVLALIARRLEAGCARYGALDVGRDRRDFPSEALEELADAAAYLASEVLRSTRRTASDVPAAAHDATSTATAAHLLGTPTATLRRSNREELRVTATEWNGRRLCDVRLWRRRDGEWIPERRGISLRPDELLGVADGLRAAVAALRDGTRGGESDRGRE